MRTFTMLALAIALTIGNIYSQPKTILHAKVVCSDSPGYEPTDADKPQNFQEYDPLMPILMYESGNQQ